MSTRLKEHQPAQKPQPLAYGYLRMADPNEAEIAELRQALGYYCQQHGYRLVTVFCDRDVRATELARPGFTSLADATSATDAEQVVVLVPTPAHLSTDDALRASLEHSIRTTGAKLVITNEVNGHAPGRRAC